MQSVKKLQHMPKMSGLRVIQLHDQTMRLKASDFLNFSAAQAGFKIRTATLRNTRNCSCSSGSDGCATSPFAQHLAEDRKGVGRTKALASRSCLARNKYAAQLESWLLTLASLCHEFPETCRASASSAHRILHFQSACS